MSECRRIEELEKRIAELTEDLKIVSEERDRYKGVIGKLEEDVLDLKKELNRPLSVHGLLGTLSNCGVTSVMISLD